MSKILIIDDEKEAVKLLSGFLTARGYEVVAAFDGDEGIRKYDTEKPDLVICDLKMPKKDGFQFLKEARDDRRWVPVVILSALTDPKDILKGYDFKADHYMTKPVNLENLLRTIGVLLSLAALRK